MATRPNVVIVCLDTLRPDCLGFGGHPVCRTPTLDALAAEGVWFDNAYAEFPLTVPFRTAAVSGTYTFTNRPWTSLKHYDLHIAEILRDAGYQTAAFSDTPFRAEVNLHRGFDAFHEYPGKFHAPPISGGDAESLIALARLDGRKAWFPPGADADIDRWNKCQAGWLSAFPRKFGRIGIELLVDEAIAWIDQAVATRRAAGPVPFFVWLDSFQAHEPWVPPPAFDTYQPPGYGGRYLPLPAGPEMDWLDAGELDHIKANYWGEISYADAHLGRLIARLDELELTGDTLVIVVSDHGVPLGEHGTIRKIGIPLYDEMAKIMWIMRWPGQITPRRTAAIVETPDLLPTVLAYCGVHVERAPVWASGTDSPKAIDGCNLEPLVAGCVDAVREAGFFGAWGLHAAAWLDGWKLIDHRGEKPNELYHLSSDPAEQRDRFTEEPDTAARLHRKLWFFQRRWARALRA